MTHFLIDSSALLALIDLTDQYYAAAASFARSHSTDTFYVPDTVFAETMTLIKARMGAKPAVDLGARIRGSTFFVLTALTPDDHEATWGIFSRYTDKEWSYVDCSIWAMGMGYGPPVERV